MRKCFSIFLIVIGLGCIAYSLYPLFEMDKGMTDSLNEWESLKAEYNTLQSDEILSESEESKIELTNGIVGILKLNESGDWLPIRSGTTEWILSQGVGLDEDTVFPGELGNSVLYGHREKIFWDLKHTVVGDYLMLETLTNTLTFEVVDTQIVDPTDEYIYEKSDESMLTLVTCYPFIYMGPTPERFIVKAKLINPVME